MKKFDFEKLEVYQLAIEFINEIFDTVEKLPRFIQQVIGVNLCWASISIANNIAEGSGKTKKDKQRFYGYSLDSARECIPSFTVLLKRSLIALEKHDNLPFASLRIPRRI